MPEPISTGGLIFVALTTGGLCVREYFKFKSTRKTNGGLQRIEKTVDKIEASTESLDGKTQKIDKSVGIIKTEVKNIHDNCQKYEKGITQNSRDILSLNKDKADK